VTGSTHKAETRAFLEHGLEQDELLGCRVARVRGTQRVFPVVATFDAHRLRRRLYDPRHRRARHRRRGAAGRHDPERRPLT